MEAALGNPSLLILFGVVATLFTSLIKRGWPPWLNAIVAYAISITFGAAAVVLRAQAGNQALTFEAFLGHLAAVAVIAQVTYSTLMNGSSPLGWPLTVRLNEWLEGIGRAERSPPVSIEAHVPQFPADPTLPPTGR
jgi:hypothetical protein